MKKLLLIAVALAATFTAKAETRQYTDKIVVTMSNVPSTQQGEIVIETLSGGNINFTLKNFVYESAGVPVGDITLGNIVLEDVMGKYAGQFRKFSTSQSVNITAGSNPDISSWYGPGLGAVSVEATGQVTDDKFYAQLALDLTASYGDILYVEVGEAMNASYYNDNLIVTINDVPSDPIAANVIVETLENGNINFVLKNFKLNEDMLVGNIRVNDLALTKGAGYYTFHHEGSINITPGDIEGFDASSYIGPIISPVPIDMNGKINDTKLYVTIDIDMMDMLRQIIYVSFGTDIPDTPDGVQPIAAQRTRKDAPSPIYDLAGRRINQSQRGIHVIEGKKVLR